MPRVAPQGNPNDPPEVATNQSAPQGSPTMPEQVMLEPRIEEPPALKLAEAPAPNLKVNRPRTPVEEDWYQFSRRVKRIGGLCKGLHPDEQKIAEQLAAKLGTTVQEGWKKMPHIPGLLNVSHNDNQKALFEKPVRMVQVVQE